MSNTTQSNQRVKLTSNGGLELVLHDADFLDVRDHDDFLTCVQAGVLLRWEPPFTVQYLGSHKIVKVERCVTTVAQPVAPAPKRSEYWSAIYAAEFVRRMAETARYVSMSDEMIQREAMEARALADWHDEALAKEKGQ